MENNKLCINSDAIVSLAEELDSIDFKFPTISTPTAGSTLFTLQDEEVKEAAQHLEEEEDKMKRKLSKKVKKLKGEEVSENA